MRNYQQQICRPHIINNYDKTYKVITVGDSFTGKTSLLSVLADTNSFSDIYTSTIGVDFVAIKTNIDGKKIKLQVWDTAGQERFQSIIQSYYKNSHGVMLIYDVTNRDSFINIGKWLKDARMICNDNVYIILIGNKSDIKFERKVSTQEGFDFAKENGLDFIEISCKNNSNCEELLKLFTTKLLTIFDDDTQEKKYIELSSIKKIEKNCCKII